MPGAAMFVGLLLGLPVSHSSPSLEVELVRMSPAARLISPTIRCIL